MGDIMYVTEVHVKGTEVNDYAVIKPNEIEKGTVKAFVKIGVFIYK
jgi:hypothetical protein